jgi:hypothetical protein
VTVFLIDHDEFSGGVGTWCTKERGAHRYDGYAQSVFHGASLTITVFVGRLTGRSGGVLQIKKGNDRAAAIAL